MTKPFGILAALTIAVCAIAAPSCSWFDKHVEPVAPAVVTCSGQTIPASTVSKVWNDLKTKNYADILTNVLPLLSDGWNDLTCIIDAVDTQNAALQPAGEEFKRQHAVEIRAAAARASASRPPGMGPGLAGAGRGALIAKEGR